MPSPRTAAYLEDLRKKLASAGIGVSADTPDSVRLLVLGTCTDLTDAFPELEPSTIGQVIMVAIGALKSFTNAGWSETSAMGILGGAAYELDQGQ